MIWQNLPSIEFDLDDLALKVIKNAVPIDDPLGDSSMFICKVGGEMIAVSKRDFHTTTWLWHCKIKKSEFRDYQTHIKELDFHALYKTNSSEVELAYDEMLIKFNIEDEK